MHRRALQSLLHADTPAESNTVVLSILAAVRVTLHMELLILSCRSSRSLSRLFRFADVFAALG